MLLRRAVKKQKRGILIFCLIKLVVLEFVLQLNYEKEDGND